MTSLSYKVLYMPLLIVAIDIHFDLPFYMFGSSHSRADVHTKAIAMTKKWSLGFPYYKVTTAVCLIFKDNNPISYGDVLIG